MIPTDILITLLKFDCFLFAKFLLLSPTWHTSTLQAIDEYCNKFENHFISKHLDILFFK